MKVRELVEQLLKRDQEAEVLIDHSTYEIVIHDDEDDMEEEEVDANILTS